jgi:hypothetical protein
MRRKASRAALTLTRVLSGIEPARALDPFMIDDAEPVPMLRAARRCVA